MKHRRNLRELFCRIIILTFIFWAYRAFAEDDLPTRGTPLSLEQCTQIALKYHPSLHAGQATVEAQKARVEQALAAYYPQINFTTGYSTATSNFSGTRNPTYNWNFTDTFSMGPTFNQMIYDFGRTPNTVKLNRENATASEQDLQAAAQNVILNVKQKYYGVLQSLALIKVAQETLTQNQKRLEQSMGFFQAGTRSKIDVTKAEVDLANAQLALIRNKNNFQVARANLSNAMGLKEGLNFAIDEAVDFKPKIISLDEILESAYALRPEILQIKAKQRSQEAAVELAHSGYYPTVSGNAANLWRTGQVPNDFAWDWSAGATLTIPVFTGFSTPSQIAEAKALVRNLQAQEDTLRQDIRLEAEQAYLSSKEAIERISVTEKSVEQAKENYELASGRYQV
ncbi:MAG: TolC family protein, partial [Candidatus Omnitrophota bacterium]